MTPLWNALQNAGLIDGMQESERQATPLWLVLLSGAAGWVAALCFIGFSVVLIEAFWSRVDDSDALVVGVIYAFIARVIYHHAAGKDFFEQLGFAVNIAAMVALLWGVFELVDDRHGYAYLFAAAILLVNGVFARYRPDAMLSVLSSVVMIGFAFEKQGVLQWLMPMLLMLMMLLQFSRAFAPMSQWGSVENTGFSVFTFGAGTEANQRRERLLCRAAPFLRRLRQSLLIALLCLPWFTDENLAALYYEGVGSSSVNAISSGLSLICFALLTFACIKACIRECGAEQETGFTSKHRSANDDEQGFETSSTGLGIAELSLSELSVSELSDAELSDSKQSVAKYSMTKYAMTKSSMTKYAIALSVMATLVLTMLFWFFPALAIAMALWLLSWHRLERLDVVFCLIAALGSFSLYYYQLTLTLLTKSLVLMALGSVLLAVGWYCKGRSA